MTMTNGPDGPDGPLRGVNLGGWLVLEKWMTPAVFSGTAAVDEYTLCTELATRSAAWLDEHRRSFITEADFEWLAGHGVQAVRLPVGYWLFGGEAPYAGCQKYVDSAFKWADRYGVEVLLDIHAVKGSQNGRDHSGQAGNIAWAGHLPETLAFVKRLVETYGTEPALWGIELLNEPSWRVPKRVLKRYYQAAAGVIRIYTAEDVKIIFNPYSMAWRWRRELPGEHVLADVHSYQCFSKHDKRLALAGHINKLFGSGKRGLDRIGRGHDYIIGEWSLTLNQRFTDQRQTDLTRRAYAAAQLLAYANAEAWFFWSYKTQDGGSWSFRDCVEQGWLPPFDKS